MNTETNSNAGGGCPAAPCSRLSAREAATICQNYIEILRDERDALPKSDTAILIRLANREIDRINGIIKDLHSCANDQRVAPATEAEARNTEDK